MLNTLANKNPVTVHAVQYQGKTAPAQVPESCHCCLAIAWAPTLFFFPPHPSPSAPAATPSPLACPLTSSPHSPSLCISTYSSVVLVTQSTSTKNHLVFFWGGGRGKGIFLLNLYGVNLIIVSLFSSLPPYKSCI